MKKSTNTRRKVTLVILLVLVPILLFLGWSQASFNLSFMRPANAPETLVLNALSALIVVAFVIFALILARILLKLYVEKRQRRLGAQFKTKMVVAFLGLSLLPVGFLFVFSYGLLNRTMDKWFGIPFDTVRRDAGEIVQELRRQSEQRTFHDAIHLSQDEELQRALGADDPATVKSILTRHASDLDLVSTMCFDTQGRLIARAGEPEPNASEVKEVFPGISTGSVKEDEGIKRLRSSDVTMVLSASPIRVEGASLGSVVALPIWARSPL